MTKRELARHLRVSLPTIDKQVKEEGMPHIRVGKQFLFDFEDVIAWLKKKSQPQTTDQE